MAFPPISPAQAIQLGVAAQAVGSAAASAFADLLRSAAAMLVPSPSPPQGTKPVVAGPASGAAKPGGTTDLSVLSGQIDSLLSQIAERVRLTFASDNRQIPSEGLTLARDSAGNVIIAKPGEEGSTLSRFLQQDELLRALFSALDARKQLLGSALSPAGAAVPLQLHVDSAGASVR